MAVAAIIASAVAATLAEGVREHYVPATAEQIAVNPALKDMHFLDVTETSGYGLDNIAQLKGTLSRANTRADTAEKKAKAFGDMDPADVTSRLAKLTTLETLDPAAEADKLAIAKVEAVTTQLKDQFAKELAPLKARSELLFSELDKAKRIASATAAIAEAGGSPDVLLPHVLSSTKFVEKDGKFEVTVVDGDGNVRIGDSAGGPMSMNQLVAEFKSKDAFAPLFSASGTTGGGAKTPAGQTPGSAKKSDMDPNARAAYIETNGSAAYLALPA